MSKFCKGQTVILSDKGKKQILGSTQKAIGAENIRGIITGINPRRETIRVLFMHNNRAKSYPESFFIEVSHE